MVADVIQIISVIAACVAALGSWRAASISSRQYKLQQEERIKKYRPFFKIKALDVSNENDNVYVFRIINEGFPFFTISNIRWDGELVIVKDFFNAEVERSKNKKGTTREIERYESLIIRIEIAENAETEGFIEINGFDIEFNEFNYKTPLIEIAEGHIKNDLKLTFQNLI